MTQPNSTLLGPADNQHLIKPISRAANQELHYLDVATCKGNETHNTHRQTLIPNFTATSSSGGGRPMRPGCFQSFRARNLVFDCRGPMSLRSENPSIHLHLAPRLKKLRWPLLLPTRTRVLWLVFVRALTVVTLLFPEPSRLFRTNACHSSFASRGEQEFLCLDIHYELRWPTRNYIHV